MIKRYWQVVCDSCPQNIYDFHKRPTHKELKSVGVINYRNKNFCSEECKRQFKEVLKKI